MANPAFATDFDGGPATDALGQNRLLALIAAATQASATGTGNSAAVTEVRSTAKEASHILKAAAGSLKQLTINNTAGSTQYYLLMNSATLPADGAVSLLFPPIPVAAGTIVVIDFPTPLVASTGIVICNGPNNSFTKAIGAADSIFYAQVI
jgi:hypothetical protein